MGYRLEVLDFVVRVGFLVKSETCIFAFHKVVATGFGGLEGSDTEGGGSIQVGAGETRCGGYFV